MTADDFVARHVEPLAELARAEGLYFAVIVVEPEWREEDGEIVSGRIAGRAVRCETGPDMEGADMLRDVVGEVRL